MKTAPSSLRSFCSFVGRLSYSPRRTVGIVRTGSLALRLSAIRTFGTVVFVVTWSVSSSFALFVAFYRLSTLFHSPMNAVSGTKGAVLSSIT